MKRAFAALMFVALLFLAAPRPALAQTAGSIVETFQGTRTVRVLSLAWTSSLGGAVSGIQTRGKPSGELLRVSFIPGTGAVQPSSGYGVTLLDEDGIDVLEGKGADLSNAAATSITPLIGDGTTTNRLVEIDGALTLTVSGAGSATQGTVKLYFR